SDVCSSDLIYVERELLQPAGLRRYRIAARGPAGGGRLRTGRDSIADSDADRLSDADLDPHATANADSHARAELPTAKSAGPFASAANPTASNPIGQLVP